MEWMLSTVSDTRENWKHGPMEHIGFGNPIGMDMAGVIGAMRDYRVRVHLKPHLPEKCGPGAGTPWGGGWRWWTDCHERGCWPWGRREDPEEGLFVLTEMKIKIARFMEFTQDMMHMMIQIAQWLLQGPAAIPAPAKWLSIQLEYIMMPFGFQGAPKSLWT